MQSSWVGWGARWAVLGLFMLVGCGDGDSPGTCLGAVGCACYGNGTCDDDAACTEEGVCEACEAGALGCACYGNDTCDDGARCERGTCGPAVSGSGGSPDKGTGGEATGGSQSGGEAMSGGASETGGEAMSGGAVATGGDASGGASASGGDASGGASETGGDASGGTSATGGDATGGTPASGGEPATGGDPVDDGRFVRADTSALDSTALGGLTTGTPTGTCQLAYPTNGTVMPQNALPPDLMWVGAADAAHAALHYEGSDVVDYRIAQGNGATLPLPDDAWQEITARAIDADLLVDLRLQRGGQLEECRLRLRIASAPIEATVHYNTYYYPDMEGLGAVVALDFGQPTASVALQFSGASVPPTGPCVSCHVVSADGSALAANTHSYIAFVQSFETFTYAPPPAVMPPAETRLPGTPAFGAFTPDGDKYLAPGNPQCTTGADSFPRAPNNFPFMPGPSAARLLDRATGQSIQAGGLDPDVYMWMPAFSPQGDKVVFNYARPDGNGGTNRRELAVMDFDASTNTFSNLRVIASQLGTAAPLSPYAPGVGLGAGSIPQDPDLSSCTALSPDQTKAQLQYGTCAGPCYPAFPSFTPDGRGVVFALIDQPDFASMLLDRPKPAKGELWYVELGDGSSTPTPIRLDAFNAAQGAETQREYYPHVLPDAVGGYAWVVWTSRRDYGTVPTGDPNFPTPSEDPQRKHLWVGALNLPQAGAPTTADPSHPPFYLEGQTSRGNHRPTFSRRPSP